MNCQQIDEHIFAYCDETLSPELKVIVDEHLHSCSYCLKMIDLCRMEKEILSAAPDIPPLSDDFSQRVMSSLSHPIAPSPPPFQLWSLLKHNRYLVGLTAAAVLLLALYLPGMMTIGPHQPSRQMADTLPAKNSAEIDEKVINGTGNNKKSDLAWMDKEPPSQEFTPEIYYTDGAIEPNQEAKAEVTMRASAYSTETGTQVLKGRETSRNKNALQTNIESDSSAAVAGFDLMANESDPQEELDLLALHPRNIPGPYQIEKIVNTNYATVSYVYRNPDNDEILEITVALADKLEAEEEELDFRGLGGSADTEDNSARDLLLNSVQTSVSYQNHIISISLQGAIPLEQLEELAKSISFEEGLSNEVVDE